MKMPREGECIASGGSSFQPLTVRGKNVLTIVSVDSAAAETLVLQAMGVSVVSAAAETLVLQAVGETHIVSAAEETLLQAVGLLVPLPWL